MEYPIYKIIRNSMSLRTGETIKNEKQKTFFEVIFEKKKLINTCYFLKFNCNM